jgi:hypothetical protein
LFGAFPQTLKVGNWTLRLATVADEREYQARSASWQAVDTQDFRGFGLGFGGLGGGLLGASSSISAGVKNFSSASSQMSFLLPPPGAFSKLRMTE